MSRFKFGDWVLVDDTPGIVIFVDQGLEESDRQYQVAFSGGTDGWCGACDLTPYTPPAPAGTVPVRIAVVTDDQRNWCARGGWDAPDSYFAARAGEDMNNGRLSWVTAHVPLPQPPAEVAAHAVEVGEKC